MTEQNKNLEKPNNAKPKKKPHKNVQSQIETQLAALYARSRTGEGHKRNIRELGAEGVDHINVSRYSQNTLGYLISTNAMMSIEVLGTEYKSIDNLIQYYKSHCTNDELRTCDAGKLIDFRNASRYPLYLNVYAVVCLGYISMFERNPNLLAAMNLNDLPLDSYTERDGKRFRPHVTATLIGAIKEAHRCVKYDKIAALSPFIISERYSDLVKSSVKHNVSLESTIGSFFYPANVRNEYLAAHPEVDLLKNPPMAREDEMTGTDLDDLDTDEAGIDLGDFNIGGGSVDLDSFNVDTSTVNQ